ncbi:MAG: glycosyltransferase [Pyrinomonadaceae bacterium]|nr:glycosyltransferase [Blastocatellia bacterium]
MIFIFYILAAALIFLSYKSFRGGVSYLNYFKSELAKPCSEFTPFASIIAPCKGLDADLDENLSALFRQDYPKYEVIFVVDYENDKAVSVIRGLILRNNTETTTNVKNSFFAKLVIADKAYNSGQKVENLREAVLHLHGETKVIALVDSDARPAEDWLRNLVAPLEDARVGAATGYRWFISNKLNFASELLSVWNASIASALGKNTDSNFCWGGSMAIRRDVFETLNIREKWRGTLSDDFTVTRALNEASMPIYFVPQALTASIEDCSFRELLEFTTRQIKITRFYAPKLWLMSFVGSGLFNLVLVWSVLIVIFSRRNDATVCAAIITLSLVSLFSVGKAFLRLKAIKLVLRDYKPDLNRQYWAQNTLWVLAQALFFYNSLAALLSRRMTWRGITYDMISPNKTKIIRGKDA